MSLIEESESFADSNHVMTAEEIEAHLFYFETTMVEADSAINTTKSGAILRGPVGEVVNYIRFQPAVARQYAYTYWWDDIDSGVEPPNDEKWRNPLFGDYGTSGGNCQNYASQIAWAGLGGSNTSAAISSVMRPLDSVWKKAKSDFTSCSAFRAYTTKVRSNTYANGVVTNSHLSLNSRLQPSQLPNYMSILPGSILHVYNKGVQANRGHAIYCLSVTGSTWNNVYYAANSNSAYNVKVGDQPTWVGTEAKGDNVAVEKINAFKITSNCNGHTYTATNDFTCNSCGFNRVAAFQYNPTNHMNVTLNSQKTVGAYVAQLISNATGTMTNFNCYQLAMSVTKPNGTETWYSKTNSYSLSQQITFNQEGIWTIRFDARDRTPSGTDSNVISYTFTIRVVNYANLTSGTYFGGA